MTGPVSLFPGGQPPAGKVPTIKVGTTDKQATVSSTQPATAVPVEPVVKASVIATIKQTGPKKHIRPPIGRNVLSCWLYALALGIVCLLALAFFVSETGFLRVPIFSNYYEAPQPVRLIRAQPMNWENFRAQMSARLIEQQGNGAESYVLPLNEEELTSLFLSVAEQGVRSKNYHIEIAQLAVTPSGLEAFLKMTWRGVGNMDLLVHMRPVVQSDGVVAFEVEDAQFGDIKMPGGWAMPLASYLFTRDFGFWNIKVGDDIEIQSISLFDRSLNIILGR